MISTSWPEPNARVVRPTRGSRRFQRTLQVQLRSESEPRARSGVASPSMISTAEKSGAAQLRFSNEHRTGNQTFI